MGECEALIAERIAWPPVREALNVVHPPLQQEEQPSSAARKYRIETSLSRQTSAIWLTTG